MRQCETATEIDAGLVAAMAPLLADLSEDGKAAVALAGSRGRGIADGQSDYDFRVYADVYRGPEIGQSREWQRLQATLESWQRRGIRMDRVWMRHYARVESELEAWVSGTATPRSLEWTIWGYQLPTDLANQTIISDPRGILAGWKDRLAQFPEALRASILREHMEILRYWAQDHHYERKVARRDLVFLAGLTGKLANAILQTVFALNRVYFPGDGWNLPLAAGLDRVPAEFVSRMAAILEPRSGPEASERQRLELIRMIADLEDLVAT